MKGDSKELFRSGPCCCRNLNHLLVAPFAALSPAGISSKGFFMRLTEIIPKRVYFYEYALCDSRLNPTQKLIVYYYTHLHDLVSDSFEYDPGLISEMIGVRKSIVRKEIDKMANMDLFRHLICDGQSYLTLNYKDAASFGVEVEVSK